MRRISNTAANKMFMQLRGEELNCSFCFKMQFGYVGQFAAGRA